MFAPVHLLINQGSVVTAGMAFKAVIADFIAKKKAVLGCEIHLFLFGLC
jgi:hypothetical protein